MMRFKRKTIMRMHPDGSYEQTYCWDYVSDGNYKFSVSSNQDPPSGETLIRKYPLGFLSLLKKWVFEYSFSPYIWRQRHGREESKKTKNMGGNFEEQE